MSTGVTKKQMAKFQTLDPDIESLQERLIKSLSNAFDPTAAARCDEFFLAQDYSLATVSDNDPFKRKPYQDLAAKARSHVVKSQAGKALRANSPVTTVTGR